MKLLYVHGYNGDPYGDSYQYNPEYPWRIADRDHGIT